MKRTLINLAEVSMFSPRNLQQVFILSISLVFSCCSGDFEHIKFNPPQANSYVSDLTTFRNQKDIFFKSGPPSPLTLEQQKYFHHLAYYPPNLDLIFQVKLIKGENETRMNIPATGGELRPASVVGEFHFEVAGKKVVLHVYRMIGGDSTELFLPFTDETCGKTSYAGGRYIDLKEDSSRIYRLDFNYAYNPYCAYNHNFSCPIVPSENYLNVPIEAGEKKFQQQASTPK